MSAPLSNDALRALFQNSPIAILVANDQGSYVEANYAACLLLRAKRDEVVGRTIADFIDPARLADVKKQWQEFLTTGWQEGRFELRALDGTTRPMMFYAKANFARGMHCSFLIPAP